MTDNTQPEALDLADWLEAVGGGPSAKRCAALLRDQHTRIAELEAQLEAIGAGGVSGPLIGQPQAMPDLSQLTERGARAWAGVDAQGLREGFTAADMATAEARGFRDGVASVAASAGSEPVALNRGALIDVIAQGLHGTWHCNRVWEAWHIGTMSQDDFEPVDESETPAEIADAVLALLTHPSTPEGMVMVPREPTMAMRIAAKKADMDHTNLSDWMVSDWPEFKRIWDAMLNAAPPTSAEGVEHG